MNESLNEDFESATITTDKETLTMNTTPEGGVSVTTQPIPAEEETLAPISDEAVAEIFDTEEAPVEDVSTEDVSVEESPVEAEVEAEDEVDVPMEEIDEESINQVSESYLKNVYENINSFKTTSVRERDNKLVVEGIINFNSGNNKKTSFIYEASEAFNDGTLKFIGENAQISRGKKTFTLTGKINENKFIAESLNYNYRTKAQDGTSTRVYGTIKR